MKSSRHSAGKTPPCFALRQPLHIKIFHFTEIRFRRMCRPSRLTQEGRREVVMFASRDAVDAAASAREVRAGRVVPVSPRLCADDGAVRLRLVVSFRLCRRSSGLLQRHGGPCVRQNRVVLTVVATVKFLRRCERAQPGRLHHSNSRGEGGQRDGRLPGDHGISRPAIAQGRPSDRRHLYAAVRFFLRVHFRAADRGCWSAPGLPCAFLDRGRSDQAKLG